MKYNYLLFITFLLVSLSSKAQTSELWGVADAGGANSLGSIFRLDENGENPFLAYSFNADYGQSLNPTFKIASNGNIYGVTANGGINDFGSIYSIDTANDSVSILLELSNSAIGNNPVGAMAEHSNGDLYFCTSQGGINNDGTIISYNPSTNTITKRFDFNEPTTGKYPMQGLTQAPNGKFYGLARSGGSFFNGTIFEFDPSTNNYTVLHHFNIPSFNPIGNCGVIMNSAGNLIGVTERGGANDDGMIFSFNLTTNVLDVLFDFESNATGKKPIGRLIETADGDYLGANSQGGNPGINGSVFLYDPVGDSLKFALDAGLNNIAGPQGSLIELNNNTFIGISRYTVYKLDISLETISTIVSNNNENLEGTPVIIDSNYIIGYNDKSNLSNLSGSLFKTSINSSQFTIIGELGQANDGATPSAGLTAYDQDKLYGIVKEGGEHNFGGIYCYNKTTQTYGLEYSFTQTDGSNAVAAMILASDGKFYGTTTENGNGGEGTIFSYDPTDSTFTNLYDFVSPSGIGSTGSLIQVGDNLYGVLSFGGALNNGSLFSYNTVNNTFNTIHSFTTSTGSIPSGGLFYDQTTNEIYGVTSQGGTTNNGVLYKVNVSTNTYTVVKEFTSTSSGLTPYGNLIQVNNKLYGATIDGGVNNEGVVFEYDPNTTFLTPIHSFGGPTIFGPPDYQLMETSTNKVFGVRSGGASFAGIVFEINTTTNTLNTTYELTSNIGSGIVDKLTEVVFVCQTTYDTVNISGCDSAIALGNWYYQTGMYNDTIFNQAGCDSVITFDVSVFNSYSETISDTACFSYTWPVNGQTYTSSGQYVASLSTFAGCDSTITLNLHVKTFDANTNVSNDTVTALFTGADSYQWIACDSNDAPISGETTDFYVAEITGNYAVIITFDGCIDTSLCRYVISSAPSSIEESKLNKLNIYPVPANETITIMGTSANEIISSNIINLNGSIIASYGAEQVLDISLLDKGVYILQINTQQGQQTAKIIKN